MDLSKIAEIMIKLSNKKVKTIAKIFVEKNLSKSGYFNFYPVVVGVGVNDGKEMAYADWIPINQSLIYNTKQAKEVFLELCDVNKEYLVIVRVGDSKISKIEIFWEPNNK